MNTNSAWAAVVVVLAGVCIALAYRVWTQREGLERLRITLANSSEPARNDIPAPYSRNSAPDTSAAHPDAAARIAPAPAVQQTGVPLSERQALEQLPSWLVIPEGQKDELAGLTTELASTRFISAQAESDPQMRKRVQAHKERMAEARRQTELKIEQLLGAQTYSLWKEYQDSATARGLLGSLNDRLGAAGLPEETMRAAAASMTQAEQRAHLERVALYGEKNRVMTTQKEIDAERESHARLMDFMRAGASPYLTLAQLQVYDQMQQGAQKAFDVWLQRQQAMVSAYQTLAQEAAEKKR